MPTSSFQSTDATAKRKVAREKVPGEKGIYRRWNADGKLVHEIAYLDRTGKQRWRRSRAAGSPTLAAAVPS